MMKKVLAIVFLFLWVHALSAQDSACRNRTTKSYLTNDYNKKDRDFIREKCQQAGLDMSMHVMANRIPTDSKLVAPKPSKHLLKQGLLHLQLPIDDKQTEFAVYHSDLFSTPATINVLQIDDELITYGSTEPIGNVHVFYGCTRGAFGTKNTAHGKNAVVYKLWDTPDRCLLPDSKMQNNMAQAEAKKSAKNEYPILIFNDLKSYGYNEDGDNAIGRFLDTMQKYNPSKLLQADTITPASRRYLSRVNDNMLWGESMRVKMAKTLAQKQEFFREHDMPWMIGNFQIHLADKNRKATTMEELEWFLSNAAAFDAGFGLDFSVETMRKHGLTDEMLNNINNWESLRLANAFSEEQKEFFKDPYGNWHLEKADDSTFLLYSQHISRRYFCRYKDEKWEWNNPYANRFALQIAVDGKGSISELNFTTPNGILYFPCTLKAEQYLIYDFDGNAYITDLNFNKIESVQAHGISFLDEGRFEVSFTCETKAGKDKIPEVTVRYITRNTPEIVLLNPMVK